jgi:hypothetical protein
MAALLCSLEACSSLPICKIRYELNPNILALNKKCLIEVAQFNGESLVMLSLTLFDVFEESKKFGKWNSIDILVNALASNRIYILSSH